MKGLALEVELIIQKSFSLKDKRRVLKSILDKSRAKYNVAAAEVSEQEILNRAVLAFSSVSNQYGQCERVLRSVIHLIDDQYQVEIVRIVWTEF